MKYFLCILFAGAAVAQWGQDDGQWRDDTHQWNHNNQWSGDDNGQWRGENSGQWNGDQGGQWNGDQGGQWNPAADGSLAGQYNPAANNWNGQQASWTQQQPAQWGVPTAPQETPEVVAARAAHLAAHSAAQGGHRWRRSAVLATAPLVTPLAAPWFNSHAIVAPTYLTARHHVALW